MSAFGRLNTETHLSNFSLDTQLDSSILPPKLHQFEEFIQEKSAETGKFWHLDYYKPLFAVDSDVVFRRIKAVFTPKNSLFDEQPLDLWCPFWTTLTLVFLISAVSHLSAVFEQGLVEPSGNFLTAASVFMFIAVAFPVGMHVLMSSQGCALSASEWVSVYGYSLIPFIPGCVVSVYPSFWLRLVVMSVCAVWGLAFFYRTVKNEIEGIQVRKVFVQVGGASGHVLIALLCVFYFFSQDKAK